MPERMVESIGGKAREGCSCRYLVRSSSSKLIAGAHAKNGDDDKKGMRNGFRRESFWNWTINDKEVDVVLCFQVNSRIAIALSIVK
jgi:hypothetical protein